VDTVMNERRNLINLAYRMLGSMADAEDVVQETYARWYALSPDRREEIEVPAAWLTRVASRICLDQLRSARVRRESYVGEWIPEPLPDADERGSGAATVDPADRITLDESVTMAFLVVLDAMTPAERVTFILHDVFRYPFAEVARVVGRSEAACRKLATSARRRLDGAQARASVPASVQSEVVRGVKEAWAAKDVRRLVGLLDPDATVVADGGGLVSALREPIVGAQEVATAMVDLSRRVPGLELVERTVNGRPGLVAQQDGVTAAVLAFGLTGDRVRHIWAVRNPEKLRAWTLG
jgi:RNA polymerase sigma factor (sigma-70 family)